MFPPDELHFARRGGKPACLARGGDTVDLSRDIYRRKTIACLAKDAPKAPRIGRRSRQNYKIRPTGGIGWTAAMTRRRANRRVSIPSGRRRIAALACGAGVGAARFAGAKSASYWPVKWGITGLFRMAACVSPLSRGSSPQGQSLQCVRIIAHGHAERKHFLHYSACRGFFFSEPVENSASSRSSISRAAFSSASGAPLFSRM